LCPFFIQKICLFQKKIVSSQDIFDYTFMMIHITLPDGAVKSFEKGVSAMDVAKSISEGLARNVLAAKFNDQIIDALKPLETDGHLRL